MRIGFYNPYLDSLAGGERYLLTLASHWSRKHQVEFFWNDSKILSHVKDRLDLDTARIRVVKNIFEKPASPNNYFLTRQYDLLVVLSDGSIPTTFAKYNILHFQRPFIEIGGRSLKNRLKLMKYQKVICNSKFTKYYIDREFGVKSQVIYPPVNLASFKSGKKCQIILSVGRFSSSAINKKQKEMAIIFRRLRQRNWQLNLVGGLLDQDKNYFEEVKKIADGLPISLLSNVSFTKLKKLYGEASLYWHAAGYNTNDPAATEHFGISVVEAMAAGCIPLVFNGGGLPEIVSDGTNGFLWNTAEELVSLTEKLIADGQLRQKLAESAQARARDFDQAVFLKAFDELLADLRS